MAKTKKGRVAVAMSGGVDSSVALLLLMRAGYEVVGFTAKLLGEDTEGSCCSVAAAYNARRVCDKLSVPHYMINLEQPFYETVITRFVKEYQSGRTPNPCVDCNRLIKFKHFLRIADNLNCDYLATGHYARICRKDDDGNFRSVMFRPSNDADNLWLLRGVDKGKDQSYFVAVITKDEMKRVIFPCGEHTKQDVRSIAEDAELPTSKTPESQDVCFLTGGYDIAYWVELVTGRKPSPGIIKDITGAELGEHPGIEYFTRGQRRGLGISTGKRKYVVEIEPAERALIVAEKGRVLIEKILLSNINILCDGYIGTGRKVSVRTRYRQKEVPASLEPLSNSGDFSPSGSLPPRKNKDSAIIVKFEHPQEFISPGQWCVAYDGEVVVACGLIESTVTVTPMCA